MVYLDYRFRGTDTYLCATLDDMNDAIALLEKTRDSMIEKGETQRTVFEFKEKDK